MAQENELGGYKVVGRLAVGGMAEVYQARATSAAQRAAEEPDEVVLKRLLPTYRNDGAFIKQFVDEAKLTVGLRHPNVVRTYRCFKAGIDYLMVLELVTGRTLAFMRDACIKAETAMPAQTATYIIYCVLKALDYVHRSKRADGGIGIVHRDVNPANVLMGVNGDVKLTDFGVAEVEGSVGGNTGALRGTIAYMSPEQVLGQPVDARTDLFACGVMLWELFANRRLFDSDSDLDVIHKVRDCRVPELAEINPKLPFLATRIARKALFADADRRFQSAAEFSRALEALAARSGWPLDVSALRPLLKR